MKAAIFVRVAAGLVLLHAVLHTVGGVFGKVPGGPAGVAVAAMKANQFVAFGNTRTFWDFYMGIGLAVTIVLTMEAVVLWLLAPLTVVHGEKVRPALIAFGIGYLVFAVELVPVFFPGAGGGGGADCGLSGRWLVFLDGGLVRNVRAGGSGSGVKGEGGVARAGGRKWCVAAMGRRRRRHCITA